MRRLLVLLVVLATGDARADTPWTQGVPQERQDRANTIFAEANKLFAQERYVPALEQYRAALDLWDHPLIRYNAAVTLIRLDRTLEAADALDQALRYGPQPFDAEDHRQALDYQKQLAGRLGHVEVRCEQSGLEILLDGKHWFVCPGARKMRVLAGQHALLAQHEDFSPVARRIEITAGTTSSETLDLGEVEWRFRRWVPWTLIGTGIALGGSSVGLSVVTTQAHEEGRLDYETARFRLRVIATSVAVAGMIVGGTGVVLLIINKPVRRVPAIDVEPTRGGFAASATWRF